MSSFGDISITRHSFYGGLVGPTLRYTESAPSSAHVHGFRCGCTVDIDNRPAGSPSQVTQSARHIETYGHLRIELELDSHSPGIWAYWPWPSNLPKLPFSDSSEGHAYFWPNNGLQIEIVGAQMPIEHALLTRMFFGQDADISRLFNGHSPSRFVDLGTLEGEVWLHDCSLGKESISLLSDEEEKTQWRAFIKDMEQAFADYAVLKEEHKGVSALRHELLEHPMSAARHAVEWAAHVLGSLHSTALLSAAVELSSLEQCSFQGGS